jgi:hypothetical protein
MHQQMPEALLVKARTLRALLEFVQVREIRGTAGGCVYGETQNQQPETADY